MPRKSGKPTRREQREQRRLEKAEFEDAKRAAAVRRQRLLVLVALLTGGAAFGVHQAGGEPFFVGLALLAGACIFLAIALGGLGGSVRRRDRAKSGNIDYGR